MEPSIGLCNLQMRKSGEQHCQIPNIQIGDESQVISMVGRPVKPRILPILTLVRIMYIMLN
ncbi:Uncharacterised protein [Yersinia enterocolitica]|nr:Uncharacterised protein [Yersinia enterocolitica]CNF62560.1 Uncharacterised protein [Yersinia enterocolitica]CNG60757.1 Uncharacterised protein [Yersinia enterocolitica]CQD54740.1 Uncharacterised protein [Yersinia enterocolitica]CQH34643.1 Uncharacterised protein [Yersinia enterocolitica]